MSTGSEVFFILEFLDDTKFVLLSFFTLVETICPNIWANKPPKNEKKSPLPEAGRGSLKTSFCLARDHALWKGKGKNGLATGTRTFLLKSVVE